MLPPPMACANWSPTVGVVLGVAAEAESVVEVEVEVEEVVLSVSVSVSVVDVEVVSGSGVAVDVVDVVDGSPVEVELEVGVVVGSLESSWVEVVVGATLSTTTGWSAGVVVGCG
jgi:hypothetical protein